MGHPGPEAGGQAPDVGADGRPLAFARHPEAVEGEADEELAGEVEEESEAAVVLAAELDAAGGEVVGGEGREREGAADTTRGRDLVADQSLAEDAAGEAGAAGGQAPIGVFVAEGEPFVE